MNEHEDKTRLADDQTQAPEQPARRQLLGRMAVAGAAIAVAGQASTASAGSAPSRLTPAQTDALLRKHIGRVVVIFAENRSFNNLFANFPGVEKPLSSLKPEDYRQRDRDGSVLQTLPRIWGGLVPHEQEVNHRRWKIGRDDLTGLPNAPWALKAPDGSPLPHGVVTGDLWHLFYQNQMQINGGKNDGFVAWGNTGAQVMGYYADSSVNLRLWHLARQYTLCDNWFMGAFGGSFLNHQYLVAAQPPYYPKADQSPARFSIAQVEGDDPTGTRLVLAEDSPASAMDGHAKFASRSTLTPDFRAVNTIGPPYAPGFNTDPHHPAFADASSPNTLPPQRHATIGDALSEKGIDWAWYGGGFQLALEGKGDGDDSVYPPTPNFQAHHQPFNYFQRFAPGTEDRKRHLRDGGFGDTAPHNRFIADIEAGALPQVSYYKPQGDLNMHAGTSDVEAGDRHIAHVVDAIQKSRHWQDTLIIITVDENGGWWDHVAPPKADRWGPGSRIPALVVSPFAKKGHVEHTVYDTGSIARFLTRRFSLNKLPALTEREEAMRKASGFAPGDLTELLDFSQA